MVIAFEFAFQGKETDYHKEIGALFVRVTRKYQPKAKIIQLSDLETGEIQGVDLCFRVDSSPFAIWNFDATLLFPAPQFLRVDYDTMIRGEVSDVFEHDFDIAIAKEHNGRMNNGVVFVKSKAIFEDAKQHYLHDTPMDGWQDIQTAMQMSIDSGLFRVRKLDQSYNLIFKPDRMISAVPDEAKIVHFKGMRKGMMLDLFK